MTKWSCLDCFIYLLLTFSQHFVYEESLWPLLGNILSHSTSEFLLQLCCTVPAWHGAPCCGARGKASLPQDHKLEGVSAPMKDARRVYCSAIRSDVLLWVEVSLLSSLLLDPLVPAPTPQLWFCSASVRDLCSHRRLRDNIWAWPWPLLSALRIQDNSAQPWNEKVGVGCWRYESNHPLCATCGTADSHLSRGPVQVAQINLTLRFAGF